MDGHALSFRSFERRVAPALLEAVVAVRPDAVLHQLTDLPDEASSIPGYAAANAHIRREGTSNLLAAARAAGATRFHGRGP